MQETTAGKSPLSLRERQKLLIGGLAFTLFILMSIGIWSIIEKKRASFYEERGIALYTQAEREEYIWEQRTIYNEALVNFNKAIELDPYDAVAYWHRGATRVGLRDFDGAIGDYTQAIKLKPDFAAAYLDRGLVRASATGAIPQDANGAIEDLSKAIALNPNDPIAYYNRGRTYLWIGNVDSAIEDFDKTVELDPNDVRVFQARGLAHQMAGNTEAALADYRLFLELWSGPVNREVIEKSITELEAQLTGE